MRRFGCVLLLVSGCSGSATYECTFDDPDAGGVFETRTLDCPEYRESGDQQRGASQSACEEEASSLGVDPATCTCDWLETCDGDAND